MDEKTKDKSLFNNRELSWLAFNERVLQEARDEGVPLMQRLRFLGIYSNNLNEFYKVRVANVERALQTKKSRKKLTGDLTPAELMDRIRQETDRIQGVFDRTYHEVLDRLGEQGVSVVDWLHITGEQRAFVEEYFASELVPRIVPLLLRKSTRIPFLNDEKLYMGVKMAVGGSSKGVRYAIIEIPDSRVTPRFVILPSPPGRTDILFIDDILRLMLRDIFFMFTYDTIEAHTFKITRDAEMNLDDDISKSLMEKMQQGVNDRLYGHPVRLVYDHQMPADLLDIIIDKFALRRSGSVTANGFYLQLKDLMDFPRVAPDLEEKNPPPLRHPDIPPFTSILSVIKKKDILLNYPYQTFEHFVDFLREAAVDPKVEDIHIAIYRIASNSKIVNALVNAAKNGKRVTALVELQARFDEERNIRATEVLQEAGVRVLSGIKGIKVHCKLALVRRHEGRRLTGYTYVGTGNFNESTARTYSDLGFFTCDQTVAREALDVFDFLQNPHKRPAYKRLLVSPYDMREVFGKLIDREIRHARAGRHAYIRLKMNALTDEKMIVRLYEASRAGVDVEMIVRGSCCLKPEVRGLSERISGISIVDKYLEHARFVIFGNGGSEDIVMMSADWMTRNLDRRVEVGIFLRDRQSRRIVRDIFRIQWDDNVKARDLGTGDLNTYVDEGSETASVRSQTALYDYYAALEPGVKHEISKGGGASEPSLASAVADKTGEEGELSGKPKPSSF